MTAPRKSPKAGPDDPRAIAQRWFVDPDARTVSTQHDERETRATTQLSVALLIANYRAMHGADPETLADIGCGGGVVLKVMEEQVSTARLSGCDPAGAAVQAARARVPQADVRHGDEPPSGPLDGVMVHLTLGLWQDPVRSLSRVLEELSSSGVLYVVDLSASTRDRGTAAALDDAERHYLEDQYAASLTIEELADLLNAAVERAETSAGGGTFVTHTGISPLGGFAFGTPEQLRLIADPGVIEALQAHAERRRRGSSDASAIPELIHGWVWRDPVAARDRPPPRRTLPETLP